MNSRLKLKQVAAASAVSASMMLGLASSSHAITLGEPGEALLVPYVLCNTDDVPGAPGTPLFNTLIGVTTAPAPFDPSHQVSVFDPSTQVLVHNVPNASPDVNDPTPHVYPNDYLKYFAPDNQSTRSGSFFIKWVFYDAWSKHIIDGRIPVTWNDFVPIDWCYLVRQAGSPTDVDKQVGYLVIYDAEAEDNNGSDIAMWGSAFLINNTWASMAYIPVMALADSSGRIVPTDPDSAVIDPEGIATGWPNEVVYGTSGWPVQATPWNAGIKLNDQDGENGDNYVVALRYVLDADLFAANEFVFWFDRNCDGQFVPFPQGGGANACNRHRVPLDVFDQCEGWKQSDTIDLPHELNIYRYDTVAGNTGPNLGVPTGNNEPNPDVANGESNEWLSGMFNSCEEELFTAINSGLVFVKIPEGIAPGAFDLPPGPGIPGQAGGTAGDYSAGVIFSLLFLDTPDNPFQVQTELGQERGFDFRP
jgi:hypothetical protein